MSLLFFLALLLLCCGYALVRGGAPERIAASLQLGAFAVGLTLHRAFESTVYLSPMLATATIDVVLLAALVALAMASTRWWPILLAGWHLIAVMAHVARAADAGMMTIGYAVQAQVWAYPMLLVTAAGAWRHVRRVRREGSDPPWKPIIH